MSGAQLHVPASLACSFEQAGRVVEQRSEEEVDADVRSVDADVSERCIVNTRRRAAVVHQFANIVTAGAKHVEPLLRQRPRLEPAIDRRVVPDCRRKSKKRFEHALECTVCAMARRPAVIPELKAKGLTFALTSEPAYLALIDVDRYEKDLPDWDYRSLTKKIVADMNAARVVAWGCPAAALTIHVKTKAPASSEAVFSARLSTTGTLCLATYDSISMCAQEESESLPQKNDHLFRVAPGDYRVDVHRLFAHSDGAPFADDDELSFVIAMSPAVKTWKPARQTWVPWALRA